MSVATIVNGVEYISLDAAKAWVRDAVAAECEACAKIIEDHAEGSHGSKRVLVPRHDGNVAGLGYAEAIRNRNK